MTASDAHASAAAVRAEGLVFRYPPMRRGAPDAPALDGVSFEVARGEVFGVLGPNGAGKTTLMKLLCTVLLPHGGRLEVLGEALPGGEERVRERLGVAFAEYERAFGYRLTGRQNLEYFGAFHGLSRRAARERAEELLALVGLTEKADVLFQFYSTGMKHRLALARALLPRPALLVLDEPTAGLDAKTARELGETVRRLASEGVAVVYTTHRLEEAATICDRVLILKDGRTAAMAAPWELARLAQDVQVVEVAVKGVLPDALDEVRALPGVSSAALEGRAALRVQTTDLDATVGALTVWLRARHLALASLSTTQASLADAFVAITEGRIRGAAPPPPRESTVVRKGAAP